MLGYKSLSRLLLLATFAGAACSPRTLVLVDSVFRLGTGRVSNGQHRRR